MAIPMNSLYRKSVLDNNIRDSGPYEAIIVNHLDPMYQGTLEVELLRHRGSSNSPRRSGQIITVRYLSPFYGVTPADGLTGNDGYPYTQKSYGFWAVPPDVGTRVLVIFAEGHAAYGYWIGCIQDSGMNFTLPDGRASTENTTDATPPNLKGTKLPTGEYNKLVETAQTVDPTLFAKPYNKDFTDVLETQGLILDEFRGTTTSSARRDLPSMVFGINSPGPRDKRASSPNHTIGSTTGEAQVPYNRLGGHSIVMDDGDEKFVRDKPANCGPPLYRNKEAGEAGGDETIPQNELFRIRTRTGHQILLHNSEDLIYIGNSRGTAWVELTSDGKIDIYSYDSISVRSENDINFTAERDFNVEAGRNINMKATARYSSGQPQKAGADSGRIQMESAYDYNLFVGRDGKITVANDFHIGVQNFQYNSTGKDYNLNTGKHNKFTAGVNTNILSGGHHRETASYIFMNGPKAAQAAQAKPVKPLPTITLPKIYPGAIRPVAYESILARAPQHEPWTHHENLDPDQFKKPNTDRENPGALPSADRILTPDTFAKGKSARNASSVVSGSGGGISSGVYNGRVGSNGSGAIGGAGSGTITPLEPGERLGVLSGAFESNGDPTTVANNAGDAGGPSYGEFQIATRTGTMSNYLTYLRSAKPDLYAALEAAGGNTGATSASPEFTNAWRTLMADPANAETQYDFIVDSHYGVQARRIQSRTGVDVGSKSRALQEVVYSVATQHGPNTNLIIRAVESTGSANPSDEELIRAVYRERMRRREDGIPVYFTGTSPEARRISENVVTGRFPRERDQALLMLQTEQTTRVADTPPTQEPDGTLTTAPS